MAWLEAYSEHVQGAQSPNDSGWVSCFCPFHETPESKSRSFAFNIKHGGWKCHGACTLPASSGDALRFFGALGSPSFKNTPSERAEVARSLVSKYPALKDSEACAWAFKDNAPGKKTVEDRLAYWQDKLEDDAGVRGFLSEERLWAESDMLRLGLGWGKAGKAWRVMIPVYGPQGELGVRQYSPNGTKPKFLWAKPGYSKNCLFPRETLENHDDVVLVEGEPDCLALLAQGVPAVSSTGGATTPPLPAPFEGKTVTIVYDDDDAGREGALKAARALHGVARAVRVVDIAPMLPEGCNDVTDGLKSRGDAFLADLLKAKEAQAPFEPDPVPVDEEVSYTTVANFQDMTCPSNFGQPIRAKAVLLGMSSASYRAYRKMRVTCEESAGDACGECPLLGVKAAKLGPFSSEEILSQFKVSRNMLQAFLKSQGGPRCHGHWVVDEESTHTDGLRVVELILGPEIKEASRKGSEDDDPVGIAKQTAFALLRPGDPEPRLNGIYWFEGRPIANPKDQAVIVLVDRYIPTEGSLGGYVMSGDVRAEIERLKANATLQSFPGPPALAGASAS